VKVDPDVLAVSGKSETSWIAGVACFEHRCQWVPRLKERRKLPPLGSGWVTGRIDDALDNGSHHWHGHTQVRGGYNGYKSRGGSVESITRVGGGVLKRGNERKAK